MSVDSRWCWVNVLINDKTKYKLKLTKNILFFDPEWYLFTMLADLTKISATDYIEFFRDDVLIWEIKPAGYKSKEGKAGHA